MYLRSSDEEKRLLRIKLSSFQRALETQRKARKELEKRNKETDKKLKKAEERIAQLETENDKLRRERDQYRDLTFKPKTKDKEKSEEKINFNLWERNKKRKRGGQKGHKGYGRENPKKIDEVTRVYLSHCPDCLIEVLRGNSVEEHIVEDIAPLNNNNFKSTKYETEIQWCKKCKKIIRGKRPGVIPKSRFGPNLLLYVMLQKYVSRNSFEIIQKNLLIFYGVKISRGALVGMMHRVSEWLGSRYDELKRGINKSFIKNADETCWYNETTKAWIWGFFTDQIAYYTISESRGKGVPKEMLTDSHKNDVLVRDDYAAYKNLDMLQQSCWAHLLRKSHDEAKDITASDEVKILHKDLKDKFDKIKAIIEEPFNLKKRKKQYKIYKKKIFEIINNKFLKDDSKRIQTRIENQNTNLITAIMHEGVPLTNNHAEIMIRPMVVIRKISGGSRSDKGTKTIATNMSVVQSIFLQNKNIVPTLWNYIFGTLWKTE